MGVLSTGSVLVGRYRLGEPLDSDGSAPVFAARDERLDRDVVVRPPDGGTRALASLSHPGLLRVHDAATQDGEAFLVTERVTGRPLSELLREEGPLDPSRSARLVAQVAGTLAYLHEHGRMHGALTPSRVLVTPDDDVKLTEVGSARGGARLTPTDDVQAVGHLLRACLDGHPHVPADLARLVARTTDPDPVRRPTAAAVAVQLETRGGEHRTLPLRLPQPPPTPAPTRPPTPPPARSSRLWPAAAAVLLAVLALALTAPGRHSRASVVPPPVVVSTPSPATVGATPSPTAAPVAPPAPPFRHGRGHHGRWRH